MSLGQLNAGSIGEAAFQTTHWSVLLTATQPGSPDADRAIAQLCTTYWCPIYAFIRRRGHSRDDALDLTQEFFARILPTQFLTAADRSKGRFRSYLLTAVKHFLTNERLRVTAQKRGGDKTVISFEEAAEARYQRELIEPATPEITFDRQWAWAVLDRVVARLRDEHRAWGKGEHFERLRCCLPGADSRIDYAAMGAALQMNEAAVRMAAHRLRRRYAEVLREEIAATVSNPGEIDDEIRHLIAVIGQP